jgi:hypothetical protein
MIKKKTVSIVISKKDKRILVGYYGKTVKDDIEKGFKISDSSKAHAYAARLADRLNANIKVIQ